MGAEPLIQVPLIDNYKKNGTANPADAAAIVAYRKSKGYGVKYWGSGTSPPPVTGSVNNGVTDIPGYTVDKFIADFKADASAMKGADSSIEILGPASWKYYPNQPKNGANDWLTFLSAQCRGS